MDQPSTGLVLMMALLLGYQWYMAPTDEEVAQWEAEQARLSAEADKASAADFAASQAALNATAALQADPLPTPAEMPSWTPNCVADLASLGLG